jgi:hypothetical protein
MLSESILNGTNWKVESTTPSTIHFDNGQVTLSGPYWISANRTGTFPYRFKNQSTITVLVGNDKDFDIVEYHDGRLTVQGEPPYFFDRTVP